MLLRVVPCLIAAWLTALPELQGAERYEADVVIYGGTSSGIIAAVQAKKMGKTVIVVGPDKHLGGLSSGGLGFTDTGNKAVIGGLSRDFYHRVWKEYQKPETWRWQKQSESGCTWPPSRGTAMSQSPSNSNMRVTNAGTSSGASQLVTNTASMSSVNALNPAAIPSSGPRPG